MKDDTRHIGLALSGGNALGAYAAGAYEALHGAGIEPDIVSGASIGAVTAAILAGNPPAERVEKLQAFWQQAATGSAFGLAPVSGRPRDIYNKMHAMQTVFAGRPGLFMPRPTGFLSMLPGTPPDLGLFDGRPLVPTLERLVDFDRLNRAGLPLVIACVDLETGEPVYFDSRKQAITPQHLLATTAFIPGFPPVEVDGRLLGDPGMFCNLPLDPLLDAPPAGDQLCFCVDLFDSRGERPASLDSALERAQDIAFSSQSLRSIEAYRKEQRLRALLAEIAPRIDAADPTRAAIEREARTGAVEVVLVAYRPPAHETGAKAIEFSRASIGERWEAGRADMSAAVEAWREGRASRRDPGFTFYDGRRHA
ncbi:patatin-like phospholipase family protein [Piscinibacter koreensis]|uniref:Patatin-like phospholipase family protein n=1 Tax=Piscinibacter koreensis TaxID=2742824 RepID=A0A7Y6NR67_9BURK|nr:patatin-like phospholipase family protein [Schlegelella koreensis]NUZ07813.1 patatin-like phospholipase family protein [Schlegelella koreensis]